MKIYQLKKSQKFTIPLEKAWAFFSKPQNLSRITPEWLNIRIISDLPDKMHSGMVIVYSVRPILNISTTWVTEIKYVHEQHFFVDEQRFGPYKFWYHQHVFREGAAGEVIMEDIISYAIPFGLFGRLLNSLFIRKKIIAIFNYREKILDKIFAHE